MSNTNGFYPSTSSSILDSGIKNDTTKHISSNNDNSVTTVNKRLKSKNVLLITVNETLTMKGIERKQKSTDLTDIHGDSNNNSTKRIQEHLHSTLEHIPSTSSNKQEMNLIINNDYCHSCGKYYDEIILCNICQTAFHLLCINPPLCKEDITKDSYFCENCRTRTKIQEDIEQKLILPFRFDSKKVLHINGLKKNQQCQSAIEQIKLPTASNGQSLVQSLGEIKFHSTNNKKSTSNCKRKRLDSSPSSTNSPSRNPIQIPNTQLDVLYRLFLSCQSEDFHGPSILMNNSTNHTEKSALTCQKYCFICRKSSIKQGPSIHCDYCPLTYHLYCLTPPIISLPLLNEKWMCPNHIEPILDRSLIKKKKFSLNQRVKISHQYSQIKQNTILQEFTENKQTKDYLLSNTINNHQFERVDISQIPRVIEEFYCQANTEQKQICENEINECKEEINVQTTLSRNESSSAYESCIWDTLQAILNHIVNEHTYEFSSIESLSIENDDHHLIKTKCNQLDTIELLLEQLNEPNSTSELCTINNEKPDSISSMNSFSSLIDLTQFHLSHAALIHLRTQQVIYIRKHVIWFGSSLENDICLKHFNYSHPCHYISERHACLYYDRKCNVFELLNYSEYGTIVNDLRYGLDIIINENSHENENLSICYCSTKPMYQTAWDGPAQIERGTVIQIGCHEFLFYRHIVR